MALDPKYITAPSLQSYFVDKTTGLPLAGGKVFFYHDNDRAVPKDVFMLAGSQANYSYAPLPNPIILSSVGTIQDNNNNDLIPYYYPYDAEGKLDLYYIVVQNSAGVPQFTRQAWPNPDVGNTPTGEDLLINYIPNGQFLAHTALENNALAGGSNVIAQGGFSIELSPPGAPPSVNTIEFIGQGYTETESASPRYLAKFSCTTFNIADQLKTFRIKFNDVNKFSSKFSQYTFAFSASSNVSTPVSIQWYKFFGTNGSPPIFETQAVKTITTTPEFFNVTIDFQSNAGYIVEPDDGDDFVAIDITFPVGQGFEVFLTDFVLTPGIVALTEFPLQTNADMLARGVAGWMDVPDGNGYDLYLPPILTRYGMTFDRSQIGEVGMSVAPVLDPSSTLPIPSDNRMPCDGASYIASEQSSNGIPFARLQDYLISANTSGTGLPLYGTGSDYTSAIGYVSNTAKLQLNYNVAGTGSTVATNGGTTNATITNSYVYNGSTTGFASIALRAVNYTANSIYVLSTTGNIPSAPLWTTNGPGVVISAQPTTTGVTTSYAAYKIEMPASNLLAVAPASQGRWIKFINGASTAYLMWFSVNGEIVPAQPGIPIEVKLFPGMSAQEVANVTRDAFNAYAGSTIEFGVTLPVPGSYIQYHSNPASLRNFFVWFTNTPFASPPGGTGVAIKVDITGLTTPQQVRDATILAINNHQYAAPDFRGMFFRGADFAGTWDLDVLNRWSNVPNIHGAMAGTFEYQQFLSHTHVLVRTTNASAAVATSNTSGGRLVGTQNAETSQHVLEVQPVFDALNSGGTETRPVNTYVFPFIRY